MLSGARVAALARAVTLAQSAEMAVYLNWPPPVRNSAPTATCALLPVEGGMSTGSFSYVLRMHCRKVKVGWLPCHMRQFSRHPERVLACAVNDLQHAAGRGGQQFCQRVTDGSTIARSCRGVLQAGTTRGRCSRVGKGIEWVQHLSSFGCLQASIHPQWTRNRICGHASGEAPR